jgi:hypothetical protein
MAHMEKYVQGLRTVRHGVNSCHHKYSARASFDQVGCTMPSSGRQRKVVLCIVHTIPN